MPDQKPMTKASRRKHLKTGGSDRCPYCKACAWTYVEYGSIALGDCDTTEIEMRCTACGRRWCDVFTLTSVKEREN